MSVRLPQTWHGIHGDADVAAPLRNLRKETSEIRGDFGDVLYYRAVAWCKKFSLAGQIVGRWEDLAAFIRWPGTTAELRNLFVRCAIVRDPNDTLYLWHESNGRVLRQMEADARAHREARKVKATKDAAKALLDLQKAQSSVGRSVGSSDSPPDSRTRGGRRLTTSYAAKKTGSEGGP